MDYERQLVTPTFEPVTEGGARANQDDVPVRNLAAPSGDI